MTCAQCYPEYLGFRPGSHGRRAAAAEVPVEVRGDIYHRAAGVLYVLCIIGMIIFTIIYGSM